MTDPAELPPPLTGEMVLRHVVDAVAEWGPGYFTPLSPEYEMGHVQRRITLTGISADAGLIRLTAEGARWTNEQDTRWEVEIKVRRIDG